MTTDPKTCATCAHWQTDTPETVYRADCGLGELTRPEAWQSCPRWAERKKEDLAPQSACRSAWGQYWGLGKP